MLYMAVEIKEFFEFDRSHTAKTIALPYMVTVLYIAVWPYYRIVLSKAHQKNGCKKWR